MNNNYEKENQSTNGFPPNNDNNFNNQNYPDYGNNFIPNYVSNEHNSNVGEMQAIEKKCKNLAVAYLCLILVMIIVVAILLGALDISPSNPYSHIDSLGMVILFILWVDLISIEIIAIVLYFKNATLHVHYYRNSLACKLWLVGIFIWPVAVVWSFMSISTYYKKRNTERKYR